MSTQRMREDTFNLLVAAGVLILVAVVAVAGVLLAQRPSCREEKKQVATADGAPDMTVTYRFDNVRQGPFVVPTMEHAWRREEVAAVAAYTISPDALYGKAVPYLTAKPSLRARPEALLALAELARGMPETAGVTLRLERGYLSWEEAGGAAGSSPYHTGYTLRVSISVEGGGSMTLEDAMTHPVAASPAAWLAANLPFYGFVRGGEISQIVYVGVPHAARITETGGGMMTYLDSMRAVTQASPIILTTADGAYHLFYLPADYGVAVAEVSEHASVTAAGDGEGGYLITLFYPSR